MGSNPIGTTRKLFEIYVGLSASGLGEVPFKHLRPVRIRYPVQYIGA